MQGKIFIKELFLENFLSYGGLGQRIELQPLNVLIGANASGKSNLMEAIRLLRATPTDLAALVRKGGGASEWLWKGDKENNPIAKIETVVEYPEGVMPLRYRLCFTSSEQQRLEIVDESIESERNFRGDDNVYFFYRYQQGHPVINIRTKFNERPGLKPNRTERRLRRENLSLDQSVISQRKDVDVYPEITYLGEQFAKIKLYTDWSFGRATAPRMPQQTDAPNDFLLEDGSNLGLVINKLSHKIGTNVLIEKLKELYGAVENITTRVDSGTIQVFIEEENLRPIPATRLSDGTLRYLCLLTILLDPAPPPLICIEEPELGLHPDALPVIAELLIEASQRTQIIVTTHSDALISAFTQPEMVLVCEKGENGTQLHRLETASLKEWLTNYTLGDLWRMGELGGNRW